MEEIKRVYYKRANTEHPDKLQARLSPEAVSLRVVVA